MKNLFSIGSLIILSLMVGRFSAQDEDHSIANNSRSFELRTYTTEAGKLEALHARFRDHTTAVFERHGMTNIGYWNPNERPNTLIYLLAHDSPEAAAQSWQGFRQDADWQRAYQASREDGPLVANVESIFLTATNYSDLK